MPAGSLFGVAWVFGHRGLVSQSPMTVDPWPLSCAATFRKSTFRATRGMSHFISSLTTRTSSIGETEDILPIFGWPTQI